MVKPRTKTWCIGGVRYLVRGGTGDVPEPESGDLNFWSREPSDEDTVDVDIRVMRERAPVTDRWDILFTSGAAWTLRRNGETRAVVFQPPGCGSPFWTALFQRDGLRVDVFIEPSAGPQPFPPLSHPLDQMILVFALAGRKGGLFHCTGLEIGGKGLMFGGKSGAGKSTLARLFSGVQGAKVLSDERVVIREKRDGFWMYGTPWHSDSRAAAPLAVPLSSVHFLHHSPDNRIRSCPSSSALHHLLPLASIPWYDRERLPALMDLCGRIVTASPCWHLHFRPDHEVVHRIFEAAGAWETGRERIL